MLSYLVIAHWHMSIQHVNVLTSRTCTCHSNFIVHSNLALSAPKASPSRVSR